MLSWNDENTPLYLRVYQYYKELIVSGKLKSGTRMPSIRLCAKQLQISRTTAETAYLYLAADGYIISKPQSGFYVTERGQKEARGQTGSWKRSDRDGGVGTADAEADIRFPFASSAVDKESFNFNLWRRYIKSALRQDERLLSYGEPQGEYELREAICHYLSKNRNAVCSPESVIVGAGVQSLLHILCPLLKDKKTVYLQNPRYLQGKTLFEDYGMVCCDRQDEAELLYLTPSQMNRLGDVMSVAERLSLLKTAEHNGQLIIEDDLNSEFCYTNKPTPCIQGLAGGDHVVYINTFSRLLLPSIRISFMILPEDLLHKYKNRRGLYNQTASKTEQIALCQFIRDGHLGSQIRKAKRLYSGKEAELCREIHRVFGKEAKAVTGQAGFRVQLELFSEKSLGWMSGAAEKSGVSVIPFWEDGERKCFLLSCSAVPAKDYPEALRLLKKVWDAG